MPQICNLDQLDMNINYMLLDVNLTCKKKDYNILLPTTTPICNQNIWLWL